MKKKITLAMICILVFTFGIGFIGCSTSDNEATIKKEAVCYVIANTANSQGLNMNSPLVRDTIYSTIRNYGYIAVINADGIPDVVISSSYDIDDKYKNASKEKLDMEARSKATNLIACMQSVIAVDPEVDYLAALRLAVRTLSSLEGYDSKTIIVLGTGLSSTGVLCFQNNLISAEPNIIVELLREKEEIPDFTGISIYWQQLGDVAPPQKALTSAQRNKLQQIYAGIVEAGGGIFNYNTINASPINEKAIYPTVTTVDFPTDSPINFELDVLETDENDSAFTEPVVLTDVTFVGDKSEYLHPDEVSSILKPIADYLASNSITILLCGTTAGDIDNDFTMTLSKERAETVKKTLVVEFGIDAERIITVGMGSSDPWHIYGVGYESIASSCNRKVVLLDVSSETAQEILAQIDF